MTENVKYFDYNKIGNDYVVGDIHGCYEDLTKLLSLVDFREDVDRLFSVGDLIDRGPDSLSVLKLLDKPWFFSALGNHEQLMMRALSPDRRIDDVVDWKWDGGEWYYSLPVEIKDTVITKYLPLLEALPYIIVLEIADNHRVNIVHAELRHNKDLDRVTDDDIDTWNFSINQIAQMTRGRTLFSDYSTGVVWEVNGLSLTYCGHSITNEIIDYANHRFIDTGCFRYYINSNVNAKLTMVRIKDGKVFNVKPADNNV